jgi:Uma2 family endonuclease
MPVTADGLLRTLENGLRRELVRGEVRKMAPAGDVHGRSAMNAAWSLTGHGETHDPGVVFAAETGFKTTSDPNTVRAPGAAFVRRGRVEAVGEIEGYWPEAPDLAVEMISTNDRFAEVEEKVAYWLAAGTRMVLVANPQGRTVTVRVSEGGARILSEGGVLGGDVVPGRTLPVADVSR